MNSQMNWMTWIHRWIHTGEFRHMISRYSSWSWIHIWTHVMNSYKISWSWIDMLHVMTYEFRYEFMYIKNCEIIPEIMGTKVPYDLIDSLHWCLAPLADYTTCISISNLFPGLLLRPSTCRRSRPLNPSRPKLWRIIPVELSANTPE